ncbi:hypothetical protein PPL_11247 [Heterostelium album PN500]|uniref:Uncharacterized protein n=1 Tax=Heterostelium pallidum (strain ATCC 26659 / Pp 5 / PN500) TaxID=670386 RepID=D3BTY7_HETP5|nr:hypothetical protein PPL_11247 [Heterostelium album PN500]EFA75173.1 hypothetical protein PPL_11247 [Heterostelium album PN500]|eukprot:XP_020427307.1 hypothetical protein PPL_11247 [Heterostelium album PN500]
MTFGIVFDIDGVLMKDGVTIPTAIKALNMLHDPETSEPRIPYVFVTNNGGFSERDKAKKISMVLKYNIDEDKVMVAHTPMKPLTEKFADKNVLVVARKKETAEGLARWYGFKHFTSIQEYVEKRPYLCPAKYSKFWTEGIANDYGIKEESVDNSIPFGAVVMFEEPADWGECIQILTDVLQSADGLITKDHINLASKQIVELHVANPDFTYGGEFVLPRYTMGALIKCLSTVFEEVAGYPLTVTYYGKPYETTYNYAKQLLNVQLEKLKLSSPRHIYAIGDNPQSDIKGANQLESEGWVSILVRTGIFKGTENDKVNPAKYVVNDVLDAVKLILELEKN